MDFDELPTLILTYVFKDLTTEVVALRIEQITEPAPRTTVLDVVTEEGGKARVTVEYEESK